MWDFSRKMSTEEKNKNTSTPSTPKDEEALLNHMTSTIRNLTRYSAGEPPKWTTLDYEHPMTEEWNQRLRNRDSATRLQKLKDATITLYRQLALNAEEEQQGKNKERGKNQPQDPDPEQELHMGKNSREKQTRKAQASGGVGDAGSFAGSAWLGWSLPPHAEPPAPAPRPRIL